MVNLNEDITHETGAHRRAGKEGEIWESSVEILWKLPLTPSHPFEMK